MSPNVLKCHGNVLENVTEMTLDSDTRLDFLTKRMARRTLGARPVVAPSDDRGLDRVLALGHVRGGW